MEILIKKSLTCKYIKRLWMICHPKKLEFQCEIIDQRVSREISKNIKTITHLYFELDHYLIKNISKISFRVNIFQLLPQKLSKVFSKFLWRNSTRILFTEFEWKIVFIYFLSHSSSKYFFHKNTFWTSETDFIWIVVFCVYKFPN